jgi:hypothetical protein
VARPLDPTLPLVFGEEFVGAGQEIDTTRRHYVGCTFRGCFVRRDASPPAHLIDCTFDHCKMIGDGWPPGWTATRASKPTLPPLYFSAKIPFRRRGYDPS